MAEEGTWESIRKNGLLSTSALLDLFEVNGDVRYRIESEHRSESVPISHPTFGSAVIRDQKPLRESALMNCLSDFTLNKWYQLLNSKVFFWLTEKRLNTLLSAKAYRDKTHTVLVIDTEILLGNYSDRVKLSPINSGSTIYVPQPRGKNTFLPLNEYPFETRKKLRGIKNAIAELTIEYSVPDIDKMVIQVQHKKGNDLIETIFQA